MEENKSGIYMIKNIVNGKVYIGSAVNIKNRWKKHKYDLITKQKHHSKHLLRSWNIYGKDNFEFNTVEYITDLQLLIPREQYWIDFYKSYDGNYGYNTSPTAGSNLGLKHSEDTKKKLSKSLKGKMIGNKNPMYGRSGILNPMYGVSRSGELSPNYGKTFSEETRRKLSESKKGKSTGVKSEATRLKLSVAHKGKKHNSTHIENGRIARKKQWKSVIQFDLNGNKINTYKCIAEAERDLKENHSGNITKCCLGENLTYKNFIFMYSENFSEELLMERLKLINQKYLSRSTSVVQLDLNGNLTNTFCSIGMAQLKTNTHKSSIAKVCQGKQKSAKGYKWMYATDYEALQQNNQSEPIEQPDKIDTYCE